MSMAMMAPKIEDLTLSITEEIHVKATTDVTFEALLEELTSGMTGAENKPLQLKIEAWPGGRWHRDLGDGNGHLWAHVQSIKRPTLLEFHGPLMMSSRRRVECAVPAERGAGRHVDQVSSLRAGSDLGRLSGRESPRDGSTSTSRRSSARRRSSERAPQRYPSANGFLSGSSSCSRDERRMKEPRRRANGAHLRATGSTLPRCNSVSWSNRLM